ncbi:acyl-CoA dehydrogenase [Caldinitratiruptor microaerophilus]|uniref:Butyryl-CoA dehydrogenase n=1 Tax=Caldinitratiruptor microaerophilus TaxID=671077 RepID=A0AA35CL03_9FIRM|nr:acyl-CoA dehydrogenase [Caldinitratiruptor microaerophilus]BDG59245.1 butyryl-CoA dehydrogenase [Caldinitratiruptor microaerophilus]
MNFFLTDEQQALREAVREFAEEEIAPRSAEYNRRHEFPRDNFRRLAELGYLNMQLPEKYGGQGLDWVSYTIVVEELARACAATAVIYEVHSSLHSEAIYRFGTEEQRMRYLPRLSRGELLGAYALTEPGAGSDAAAIQTRAERRGDVYVLNGQKAFITSGGVADSYIVFARTDPAPGHRGITAFIVEKGAPGLRFGPPERKMGLHASPTTAMYLEDCRVPVANRLGDEGQGFAIAMAILDRGRVGIGAQAVGIAQAALDDALAYARQRHTFGKPIAEHQAIAFKLADMATEIDAARLLVYRAAFLLGQGRPCRREVSMAKLFASEVAMRATTEAVQILGGYGYMEDYRVERLMREAKVTQIYEGTSEIQRIVISRELLRGLREEAAVR